MPEEIPPRRALVVDDSDLARRVVQKALEHIGVTETRMAGDGGEALSILDAHPMDVVICDLNMPGMDGVEFLRHLARSRFGGEVILISGEDRRVLDTAAALARAHDLRVLGSLVKPVTAAALADVLSLTTGDRRGEPRSPAAAVEAEDLRAGIENGELTVYYQPKVNVRDGALVGAEGLARWRRPGGSIVLPEAFISVAEANGLIDDLTRSVISQAMRDIGPWRKDGLDIKIAINLSMDSLSDLDLPETVSSQVEGAGLAAGNVVLEITESRLMKDPLAPLETLTRLRLKGLSLSIDDFGTGYSSMEQLKNIPFTEMKIDRAFVGGASRNPATRAILESAVDLAKKMEMTIVAEGVETREDWDLVAALGVDLVQGFFVAKPMPAEEFRTWALARLDGSGETLIP